MYLIQVWQVRPWRHTWWTPKMLRNLEAWHVFELDSSVLFPLHAIIIVIIDNNHFLSSPSYNVWFDKINHMTLLRMMFLLLDFGALSVTCWFTRSDPFSYNSCCMHSMMMSIDGQIRMEWNNNNKHISWLNRRRTYQLAPSVWWVEKRENSSCSYLDNKHSFSS